MDELDNLIDTNPLDKFIDVLQNAPRGAVELTMYNHCKEVVALRILLEQKGVSFNEIEQFIFENDNELVENSNDIYIDLTAKILGCEG